MSVTYHLLFEEPLPEMEDLIAEHGEWIGEASDLLDKIAEDLDLLPLSTYFGEEEDFEEDLFDDSDESVRENRFDEEEDEEEVEESWYEPSEGLITVQGLLDHLRDFPTAVEDPDDVIEDLAAWERILTAADEKGIRFRVGVDL